MRLAIAVQLSLYHWRIQRRGPPPLDLSTKMRPEGPKKISWETTTPPYLRVYMTAPSPPPPWIRHSTLGVFIREVVSGPTLDNRIQAIFNIQPIKIFFNKSVLKQDQRHTFTPIRKTRSHLSDQYHEVCLSNPNHVIKILFRFLYRLQKCQHEEPHAVKILSRNLIS